MSESFKHDISQADFKLFLALWNQCNNQSTPHIHFKIASWLEQRWNAGDKNLLLMAFRAAGKSTIVGLFCAWLLYIKPELRILVLAADQALAGKMVSNVRKIIEKHPLMERLIPKNPDQWASDRFTIKRPMPQRDPSMLAKGVSANMTGSRADIVICDDVEVPNTCDTAGKRESLRESLSELSYVLVPGGTQLFVGTPHSYYSIYADAPRVEIGEDREFLSGFRRLKIPIMDVEGNSAWLERYGEKDIDKLRRQAGPHKFRSQMMLEAVNITEGRLDASLLRFYDDDLDYTKELNTLFFGERKIISASAYWDPAFGSAKGDRSVLACVFVDDAGDYYVHKVHYIQLNEVASEQDEATHQCEIITQIAKQFMLPSITVETNGIGKFLPAILRNVLAAKRTPISVRELHNTKNKDMRILEAFDALLAARKIYVHQSVSQTPFLQEMREWKPSQIGGHDDGLDAVAGALAEQPLRIQRLYGAGAFSWAKKDKTYQIKNNFKV